MKYRIWSIEHNAWWNWARHGYVKRREHAGRYTEAEAIEICKDANLHVAQDKPPMEAMVPVDLKEEQYPTV